MYIKHKNKLYGFTLTELLIGLTLGIVVLTGLMSFYFRSSKMIGEQQAIVKNLSQMQFVMNKIAEDIKSANTQAPESGASSITQAFWDTLPYAGYGKVYVDDITLYQGASGYPKDSPTYPVAYNFVKYQGSDSPSSMTSLAWYPKQDPLTIKEDKPLESNELVFYKVIDNKIARVIYYTEVDPLYLKINPSYNKANPNHLVTYNLRKKIQYSPTSEGKLYVGDGDPKTLDSLILSDVKCVQFTYPLLTKKLAEESTADPATPNPDYVASEVDNNLKNEILLVNSDPDTNKRPFLRSVLMNPYRNIIKIRITTAGPQVGNKRATAFELSTEVTIRN